MENKNKTTIQSFRSNFWKIVAITVIISAVENWGVIRQGWNDGQAGKVARY